MSDNDSRADNLRKILNLLTQVLQRLERTEAKLKILCSYRPTVKRRIMEFQNNINFTHVTCNTRVLKLLCSIHVKFCCVFIVWLLINCFAAFSAFAKYLILPTRNGLY